MTTFADKFIPPPKEEQKTYFTPEDLRYALAELECRAREQAASARLSPRECAAVLNHIKKLESN